MTDVEEAQASFAEARRAAHRLFLVAEEDTSASRVTADFLLAWWNAGGLGGFDPTDLWHLDRRNTDDVVRLISLIGQAHIYPDAFVPRERVVTLVKAWRPHVTGGPDD